MFDNIYPLKSDTTLTEESLKKNKFFVVFTSCKCIIPTNLTIIMQNKK